MNRWRTLNTDVRQFTRHKPNGQITSRVDYGLVSESISQYVTETTISNCPLSDHRSVNLKLKNRDQNNTFKDYWKLNYQLLRNAEYCNFIKKLILDIKNNDAFSTSISKWEYLKFSVRKTSIAFGKKLNKQKRERNKCGQRTYESLQVELD